MTRFIASTLLALSAAGTGVFTTVAPAQASSCTDQYYVCLNNNVYTHSGFRAILESVECGVAYFGCLARKA